MKTLELVKNDSVNYTFDHPSTLLKKVKSTLLALKEKHVNGPKRELSNDMTLSLDDYHLKKATEDNYMIYIKHLEFKQGTVYAIIGKIGTGKTTLISDIAKCLTPIFSATGIISYPTNKGEEVQSIFCGSIPFVPPATTLLERLTYRIPEEYREQHKEELLEQTLNLFCDLEQTQFIKEMLQIKGKNEKLSLSTGQGKMVMLIAAILYKLYLKQPILLVIDETLDNLDVDTKNSVCNKIKEVFNDSIILSVDHNAQYILFMKSMLIYLDMFLILKLR